MTEYGLCIAHYQTPWEDPEWMRLLIESRSKLIRAEIQSNVVGSSYWNYIKLHADSGFKILGIFSRKLATWTGTPDWEPIQDLAHWRTLVQKGLQNYGQFLSAIEMWGEPDLQRYHSGYMDGTPEHYTEMLQVLYEEVQVYNPGIPIIAGSIAVMRDTVTEPVTEEDYDHYGGYFLKRIYELGASNFCDVYSVHIYRWFLNGESGLYSATDVYNKAKVTVGREPVWVSEMGSVLTDESSQAQEISDWLTELELARVPFVYLYKYYGGPTGLIREDLTPKPSYYIFQDFATPVSPILSTRIITDIFGATTGSIIGYQVGGATGAGIGTGVGIALGEVFGRLLDPPIETSCFSCDEIFNISSYDTPVWCPHCRKEQMVRRG